MDIPDLLEIVQDWDREIRSILPPSGLWFAPIVPWRKNIDTNVKKIREMREWIARSDFRKWLKRAGLPYHSPHKFRRGHIRYGLDRAKSLSDYKAVSMNAMHSSIIVTDRYYATLREEELKNRIRALSQNATINSAEDRDNLVRLLEDLATDIRGGSSLGIWSLESR